MAAELPSDNIVSSTPSRLEKVVKIFFLMSNEQMMWSVPNQALPRWSNVMLRISSEGRPDEASKVSKSQQPLESWPIVWQMPPPIVPTHILSSLSRVIQTTSLLIST